MSVVQLKNKNIHIIRTVYGEVFIGNLMNDVLEDALAINVTPTEQNNDFSIMLIPIFAPLEQKPININVSNIILAKTEPSKDLLDHYNQIIEKVNNKDVKIPEIVGNNNE